jgi:DNA-binding transcriptional LysR family regulator
VELRHLRYFVAVAEELHFRRAAERLHVAQPAVSEQVRKLEQELGVRLFDRTRRSVELTTAGTALLDEARRVLRQAEIAMMAARNAQEQATVRLRIGYLPDSLPLAVPQALRHLRTAAPRVETQLETGSTHRLMDEVRASRLDAAVIALPAPTKGLRTALLGGQRPVAAVPVTHPLAHDPSVPLERLAPERIVVLPRDTNPAFHNAVISICRDAGLSPTFVEVAEPRVEQALMAVAAGAGVALLPESVADRFVPAGLRFLGLDGAAPAFDSAVVTRPDCDSLATASFLRALSVATRPRQLTAVPAPGAQLAA